ncbi:MAG: hypothetical protein PHV34_14385 [Verrucomicrobiae bacterium]|nr:hypothetical protein [Verrucomicrobiae bacterium]
MPPSSLNSAWDFFPLVICINLKERNDRYDEIRQELRRVGMKKLVFYRTKRQPDGTRAGAHSHMMCLKYAVQQGVSHVLMFEDDALFLDGYEEAVPRAVDFMRQSNDWNMFYLGGLSVRRAQLINRHILRGAFIGAHAYAIRIDWAKQVLAEYPWSCRTNVALDHFYTLVNGNRSLMAVNPMICTQRVSPSDTGWEFGNKVGSGWYSQAMIYTSMSTLDRIHFKGLTDWEKFQFETGGRPFLFLYRHYLRLKVALSGERRKDRMAQPFEVTDPAGEFIPETL